MFEMRAREQNFPYLTCVCERLGSFESEAHLSSYIDLIPRLRRTICFLDLTTLQSLRFSYILIHSRDAFSPISSASGLLGLKRGRFPAFDDARGCLEPLDGGSS